MSELKLRSRMTNLLLVIPNLLLLCTRLMVDPRVPAKERLLVAGAIVYAFMPLDFIPDVLPFVGQVDDAYLISLTLLRLMTVTEPRVVREHWISNYAASDQSITPSTAFASPLTIPALLVFNAQYLACSETVSTSDSSK